ncbi:MAG: hypothetical protein QM679_05765 [Patulibacter sp.]
MIVDASALVDVPTPKDADRRTAVLRQLPDDRAPWTAPEIVHFEVFSAVRRAVLQQRLRAVAADNRTARYDQETMTGNLRV